MKRVVGLLRRYWKTHLKDHFNKRFSYHTYNNLHHQLLSAESDYKDLPEERNELSETTLKKRYNKTVAHYKKVCSKPANFRHQLLEALLGQYEHDEDPHTKDKSKEKAQIVQRTIQGGQCQDTFKSIGNTMTPKSFRGVQRLLLAQHNDEMDPVENPTELLRTTKEEDIVW